MYMEHTQIQKLTPKFHIPDFRLRVIPQDYYCHPPSISSKTPCWQEGQTRVDACGVTEDGGGAGGRDVDV